MSEKYKPRKASTESENISIQEDYDPVQAEIIRRRLYNIADEMATVMVRTSGDPVMSEAVDFSTVILTPEGELDTYSAYVTFHHGPARTAVRHILDVYSRDEINPGDQFICNDPHTTGQQHPPDVGIIKPIFYDGELLAWCWSEAHLLDVGGVAPGGFAPQSTEAYSDALRWPGIKIVEEGEIIEDIKRLHNNNVRLPNRVFNDIRAMIAANNRCEQRLVDTVDEFGIETIKHYRGINKQLSEKSFENRIDSLPDGTYSTTEYVEHDGQENKIYELPIELTIDGREITVDYSGAAEQAPGFVNLTWGGTVGCTMTPVMLTLAPDIPPNEGLFNPVEIVAPEGTITNANMPAGVSSGHMETGMHMMKGLTVLFSRVMAKADSAFVREHPMGPFQDTWNVAAFYGMNQYGEPDVHLDMNGGGAGGGAQSISDGLDAGGVFCQLNNGLPDIEINEDRHPQLYLWRRLNKNAGGPGEFRGGEGIDYAWTLHDVEGGQLTGTLATAEVPTEGVLGGYPGSTNALEMIQDSDINTILERDELPASFDEVDGDYRKLPSKKSGIPITNNVVFADRFGGGSGTGDPLERDRDAVVTDVKDGYITEQQAEQVYGVVLADGEADTEATRQKREELHEKRRSWNSEKKLQAEVDNVSREGAFHRYAELVSNGDNSYVQCSKCESLIAPFEGFESGDDDWLAYTATNDSPIKEKFEELSLYVKEREEEPSNVRLREHACPQCGVLFRTEVRIAD